MLASQRRPNPRNSRSPQRPQQAGPSILTDFGHRGLLVAFHGFFAPRDSPTTASGWRAEGKRRVKTRRGKRPTGFPSSLPPPDCGSPEICMTEQGRKTARRLESDLSRCRRTLTVRTKNPYSAQSQKGNNIRNRVRGRRPALARKIYISRIPIWQS